MARTIEIRPLRASDNRAAFCCGEPAIDRFFAYYAGQNQFKLGLAVTYVAVVGECILGFATVAVGSIERREVPHTQLRRRLPSYPLPILRLARLGVDQSVQGGGLGHQLLRHVFSLARAQRDTLGCIGVLTDAKPDAIPFYQKLGFTQLEGVRSGSLIGHASPMFLDIQTIAVALETRDIL